MFKKTPIHTTHIHHKHTHTHLYTPHTNTHTHTILITRVCHKKKSLHLKAKRLPRVLENCRHKQCISQHTPTHAQDFIMSLTDMERMYSKNSQQLSQHYLHL